MHVGIVGAGIGGLAAAIAFRKAGVSVTVLESAEELGEVSLLRLFSNLWLITDRENLFADRSWYPNDTKRICPAAAMEGG